MNQTANQIYIFALFVLAGIVVGFLYSLTHFQFVFRQGTGFYGKDKERQKQKKFTRKGGFGTKIAIFIADFVLAAICLPFLFFANLYCCSGQVRLYTLFALVVGIVFYCKTCKCFIDKGAFWLYNGLTKLTKRAISQIKSEQITKQ